MTRTTARAIDKTIVLAATLCLAGNAYGVPSPAFWLGVRHREPYLLIVLLAVIGLFGALNPVETWSTRNMADRSVTMKRRIMSAFGKLLAITGAITPSLPTSDLALHIWRRQRTIRHPVSGVLRRVATYRLGTIPGNRTFLPTRGVGVVGLCWERNHEISENLEELVRQLTTEAEFDTYVQAHGDADVLRLSWTDFHSFRHRTALFAAPIRNGRGQFIGCISVDTCTGFEQLDKRALMDTIGDLALNIGQEDFGCV